MTTITPEPPLPPKVWPTVEELLPTTTPADDFVLRPGLVIMLDIDDVLYPWYNTAHLLCEKAGITNGKTPTQWSMWLDYGCSKEDWLKVIDEGALDGTLYSAKPFGGVVDALTYLREEKGHHLHLVTARGFFQYGDIIRRHTVEWLYYNDIPHDALSFCKDKAAVLADVYLDDGVHNIENLRYAGRNAYLMDAPHNREYSYDKRVRNFDEFIAMLESK